MSIKCPFITNLVLGKVEKENHIRKFWKSEERKVKNIGKNICPFGMEKTNFVLISHRLSSHISDLQYHAEEKYGSVNRS